MHADLCLPARYGRRRAIRFMVSSLLVTLAVVLLGAQATLPASAAASAPRAQLRVELWGDSLSAQAGDYFGYMLAATGKAIARERVFGGTALCDWLSDMRAETNPANKAGFHPQVAVLQFSGNAFTPCMQDGAGASYSGQALVDKYAADAAVAVGIFSKYKIPVYFASSPMSSAQSKLYTDQTPLGTMYAGLPAKFPAAHLVRFIDAASPLEWHGKFSATLPCARWEKCTGRWPDGTRTVIVRQSDGVHFCPVAEIAIKGVLPRCPAPSPGAERFAIAMIGQIAHDYRL